MYRHISRNRLLNGLPPRDMTALMPLLTVVDLAQGVVIMPDGADAKFVFFPISGMISLVMVMLDGKAIETATIGRDGGVGLMSAFGPHHSLVRGIVQLPAVAIRIPASAFCAFAATHPAIETMALAYNEVLLKHATVTAACNGLHNVEARFCRWVLQTRDCAESDVIPLTQEFLSEMLGVRRTSVSDVATKLQTLGFISYARGVITVRDVRALEKMSCECYETLRVRELVSQPSDSGLPSRALLRIR